MFKVGNIYVIAATAVIGGALFGFDISSMSAIISTQPYKCQFNRAVSKLSSYLPSPSPPLPLPHSPPLFPPSPFSPPIPIPCGPSIPLALEYFSFPKICLGR